MAKKNYRWGKGYDRRQQEAQRKESKQAAYSGREKGRRPMEKEYSQEELAEAYQEAEAATWKRRADKYREAWEAEKKVSQSYVRNWTEVTQRHAKQRKQAALRGALIGIASGLLLGLIIGAYLL